MKRRTADVKIDKSRPCNLDFFDEIGFRQMLDNLCSEFSWIRADGFCETHRDIRCEISVAGVPGAFHALAYRRNFRRIGKFRHVPDSLLNKMCNIAFQSGARDVV